MNIFIVAVMLEHPVMKGMQIEIDYSPNCSILFVILQAPLACSHPSVDLSSMIGSFE